MFPPFNLGWGFWLDIEMDHDLINISWQEEYSKVTIVKRKRSPQLQISTAYCPHQSWGDRKNAH